MISIITSLNVYVQTFLNKTNCRRNAIQSILAFSVLVFGAQNSFAQAPSFTTCPGNPTVTLPAGDGGLTLDDTNIESILGVAASDPGGGTITYSASPSSILCSDIGPGFSITVTATNDAAPNESADCPITVEVIDGGPFALCTDITVNLDPNMTMGAGTYTLDAGDESTLSAGSSACTGISSVTVSETMFDCMDVNTTISVTVTVEDGNGATAFCLADITVLDDPPVATCQDVTIMLDGSGNASTTAAAVDNGSTVGSCGMVNLSLPQTAFNCSEVGANTVTLTVNDGNGQTDTDNCTVTVQDNMAPTAICQDITVQLNSSGSASITASQINNGSTDNCPGNLTLSIPAGPGSSTFGCIDVGPNSVTLTVSDGTTSDMCSATVTVEDTVAPTAICQNITVELDPISGDVTITPMQIDNGSNDACGIMSTSLDITMFDCDDIGANSVMLTVTDNNTNSSTCSATVTVEDNEDPVIDPAGFPSDITLDAVPGDCSQTYAWAEPTVTDNCSTTFVVTTSPMVVVNTTGNPHFATFPVGTTTVTYTYTDDGGNTATDSFDVTIEDNEDPVAMCEADLSVILEIGPLGFVSLLPDDVDNGSTDNCGIVSLSVSPNLFLCGNANDVIPAVLVVTDAAGNTSSCSTDVIIVDAIAPTITCPADLTVSTDMGVCNADVDLSLPAANANDNCDFSITNTNNSMVVTQGDDNASGIYPLGVTTVEFTVTEDGGDMNSASCTMNITVEDNEDPIITCPIDLTVDADDDFCDALVLDPLITATASDNCMFTGSNDYTMTNTLDASAIYPLGTTQITFTATDDSGNSVSCNTFVTVIDTQDPTQDNVGDPGVPSDGDEIFVNASPGCSATVSWTAPTFTDNCLDPVIPTSTNNPGDVFPVDTTTVSYTAIDPSGNATVVSFKVIVTDGVAPNAGCQPNPINLALDGSGSASLDAQNDVNLGSFDACGIDSYLISVGGNPFVPVETFDCNFLGTYSVILRVSDGVLEDECTATVTISDNIAPTAICQDITVSLDGSGQALVTSGQIDNGSFDNTNCINLFLSPTVFDCDDIGSNFVTLTVSDNGGNSDFDFCTVTVQDNMDPTLSNIPGDVLNIQCDTIPDPPAIDLTGMDVDAVTATDNCAVDDIVFNEVDNQSSDPTSCNFYNYTITRTWTALDVNGNSSIASQTLTVEDTQAPSNPIYAATNNVSDGSTISQDPTSCFASVQLEVIDLEDCADFANLTVTNNQTGGGADASGLYGFGTHTVWFTATDPCGNSTSWSITFTVNDQVAPTASCVGSLNLGLPSSGILVVSPFAVDNSSFDNCFGVSRSVSPDTLTCDNVGMANNITLTVTDPFGNSSTCNTTINLQENNAPTVLVQDITVTLGPDNTVTITADDVDGGSFDDCTDVTLSISQSVFTDADLGANTIQLTAMDENGNSATEDVTVTVTLPPTCFDIPSDLSGGAGDVVQIPITAEDFTALVGFQFEVGLDNPDIGEFTGISSVHPDLSSVILGEPVQTDSMIASIDTTFVPDQMGMDSIAAIDTTYSPLFDAIAIAWAQGNSDPMTGNLIPLTFGPTDVLFNIDLMLTGEIGDNSDIMINTGSMTTPTEVVYSFSNNLYSVGFTPCPASPGFIQIGQIVFSGQIYTENADPVALVEVNLVDQTPLSGPGDEADTTGIDGLYSLTTTGVDLFEIQPMKDINWPNGIDILDVGLIQRHTVGNPYVGSAYKKIAADVSGDFVITTFDAVLLNAFLASFFDPSATPPTPSWQFADAKQGLMNAQNAFVPSFNNYIELPNITSDSMGNDFIAVKTGDLGGLTTADVTAIIANDNDTDILARTDNTLKFMISDRSTTEGEIVNLAVSAANFEDLMAYQWILKFNPEQLRFEGASEMQDGNFTFSEALLEDGQLLMTWFAADDVTVTEKDIVFNLKFTAMNTMTSLEGAFEIVAYEQFKAVAYRGDLSPMNVELIITEAKPEAGAFVLNQNIPNPFKDQTVISFYLPESADATLQIMDVTGRVLKVYQGDFSQGYNEVSVNRSELPQAGTLFYELRTSEHTASKKMIIID